MKNILVIDDHPVFVDGITSFIRNVLPNSNIVTCVNGDETLKQLHRSIGFDWIFLDINLPDVSGLELLKQFLELKVLANVIVVSSDENPETIHAALELHANGFISKQFNTDVFKKCMQTIERGGVYLDKQQAQSLKNYREGIFIEKKYIQENISERQQEALLMISKGLSNQEIAALMNISESTVKTHISLLMNLFEADNRSHCVAEAKRLGFTL